MTEFLTPAAATLDGAALFDKETAPPSPDSVMAAPPDPSAAQAEAPPMVEASPTEEALGVAASEDDMTPSSPEFEPESPDAQAPDAELYGDELVTLKMELGDTHPDTLTALNNRAVALFADNKLKQAATLFKEAIKDKRGSLGLHKSTALSIANLGKLYKLTGKPKRAREYLQEAYEMRQELLGKRHPDTLMSMNHLGSLLYSLRELERAEALLTECLKRSRKARGSTDSTTLTCINNLGNVLHSRGDLDGALRLLKEAVESSRSTLGEAHVETLISISNLGVLLRDMAFRGTAKQAADAAGKEGEGAAVDLNGDGTVDENERRQALMAEAQELLAEAVYGFRMKRAELGENHPHVRSIGTPDWEADIDLSAFTISQGVKGSAKQGAVDAETRKKLRMVFDKFDEDGSGAVSTGEMTKMIQQLELSLSSEEIAQLMRDADPDGSGQIEFEEFVTVMAEQMNKGGGLADVVSAAGNLFGWVGGLASWFSGEKPAEEKPVAPVAPVAKPLDEETRKKLRMVFDKFDEDRSGAVSTYEMTKMVNELGLELGPAEIGNLMKEADPDGSGQIDFDEFVSVMQGQMAKGDGGGLANIVSAAGNLFGWVNPLSWFGGK